MAFHIYRLGKARTIQSVIYLLIIISIIITFLLLGDIHIRLFSDTRNETQFFHPRNVQPVQKNVVTKPTIAVKINHTDSLKQQKLQTLNNTRQVKPVTQDEMPCYDVHAFYYPWYGNPTNDEKYYHWNHEYIPHWNKGEALKWPKGRHSPPDDIGSNYYPSIGPYSSSDPSVIDTHMQMMRQARIGVVVVSWYPPGNADNEGKHPDSLMPMILDSADKYNLKVAFHIEPYKNRTQTTLKANLKYILEMYGNHSAFYRREFLKKKSVPLYYIYDSYLTKAEDWAKLLTVNGQESIRNTELDGVFIGLFVEAKHGAELSRAGYDGFYTYFATNGFTYGSSWKYWEKLSTIAKSQHKLFIPSVGPGYIDTEIRPWNKKNTRERRNGKYYDESFSNALKHSPSIVSITSFNEWHEGSQIEPAVEKVLTNRNYLDYKPNKPDFYLKKTKEWVQVFMKNH